MGGNVPAPAPTSSIRSIRDGRFAGGARLDGVADDAAAFEAAREWANASGGLISFERASAYLSRKVVGLHTSQVLGLELLTFTGKRLVVSGARQPGQRFLSDLRPSAGAGYLNIANRVPVLSLFFVNSSPNMQSIAWGNDGYIYVGFDYGYTVASAVPANPGSKFAVNDTITLTGGTVAQGQAQSVLKVTSVDANGAITGLLVQSVGGYSVSPANPVAQGSTSGSGTGATFTLTMSAKMGQIFRYATSGDRDTVWGQVNIPVGHCAGMAYRVADGFLYTSPCDFGVFAALNKLAADGKSVLSTLDLSAYGYGGTFTFDNDNDLLVLLTTADSAATGPIVVSILDPVNGYALLRQFSIPRTGNLTTFVQGVVVYQGNVYVQFGVSGQAMYVEVFDLAGRFIEEWWCNVSGEPEGMTLAYLYGDPMFVVASNSPNRLYAVMPPFTRSQWRNLQSPMPVNAANATTTELSPQLACISLQKASGVWQLAKRTTTIHPNLGDLFNAPVATTTQVSMTFRTKQVWSHCGIVGSGSGDCPYIIRLTYVDGSPGSIVLSMLNPATGAVVDPTACPDMTVEGLFFFGKRQDLF